ncbi:hypothetical protein E4T50_08735 [Aureobasidium sp. EXF-12298]|nr:hypothetical protein E4T50_08735 [Aureobasidium sp. EXF-12298]
MSQVSSWATSAREGLMRCPANIDNTNEDLQAIDVIENFLTGGQSVLRAAHRIATIYEPRLRTSHRNDITVLWGNICQNDAEWHAQAPQLLNITVFAATLMVRSDASIAMEMGVDRPYDNTRELPEEWRMYIPPAATWILIAGSKIRGLCFTDELPETANQHSIRCRWGGRTFCSRRWDFWKRRFQQLAEDTAISDRCQGYAKQAYGAMDKLDAEN